MIKNSLKYLIGGPWKIKLKIDEKSLSKNNQKSVFVCKVNQVKIIKKKLGLLYENIKIKNKVY